MHLRLPNPVIVARSWAADRADDWATESQLVARRNAMVAATACAQRRAERLEVEEFLRSRVERTASSQQPSQQRHA